MRGGRIFVSLATAMLATGIGAHAVGCSAPTEDLAKSDAAVRAERRAYDGAPPVVPHEDFGIVCSECHNEQGMEVRDVGFAPPSPHELTEGMNELSRCRQCHVFRRTDAVFAANGFVGLRQDLRRGPRLNPFAPPTIPHKTFMRENCVACHAGAAAREPIRTPHPERSRCRQCHVPVTTRDSFSSDSAPGAF
jgi:cytochrome c-type protein NapB